MQFPSFSDLSIGCNHPPHVNTLQGEFLYAYTEGRQAVLGGAVHNELDEVEVFILGKEQSNSVLLSSEYNQRLATILPTNFSTYSMCFRSSAHSALVSDILARCSNLGTSAVFLLKSNLGNLFGAYIGKPVNISGPVWLNDPASFVFALNGHFGPKKYMPLPSAEPKHLYFSDRNSNLQIGETEISLNVNFQVPEIQFSHLGKSYGSTSMAMPNLIFTNTTVAALSELEVYAVDLPYDALFY